MPVFVVQCVVEKYLDLKGRSAHRVIHTGMLDGGSVSGPS